MGAPEPGGPLPGILSLERGGQTPLHPNNSNIPERYPCESGRWCGGDKFIRFKWTYILKKIDSGIYKPSDMNGFDSDQRNVFERRRKNTCYLCHWEIVARKGKNGL